MSIGFDWNCGKGKDELSSNKSIKSKYHVWNMLKDVFGFAENQEKPTYGLSYKLTPKRNKKEALLDKAPETADARNKVDHIPWYGLPYTASVSHQVFCQNKFWLRHPLSFDILKDPLLWKKYLIKIIGLLNWVVKKTWMFPYGLL